MRIPLQRKSIFQLCLWILALLGMGAFLSTLTKPEIGTWYAALNRSALTPPNAVFPMAWTALYIVLGYAGWLLWQSTPYKELKTLKALFVAQLLLNWLWTPVFFHYHRTGLALGVLVLLDICVGALILFSYKSLRTFSILLAPYFLWIVFATHLNFHVWHYN